jgi:hypothetical protein
MNAIKETIKENSKKYVVINPELSSESSKSLVMNITPELLKQDKKDVDINLLTCGVLKDVAVDLGKRTTTNENICVRSHNNITINFDGITLLELINYAASSIFIEFQKKPRDMSDSTFTKTFQSRNINIKARNVIDAKTSKNEIERMLKQGFSIKDVISKEALDMQSKLKAAGVEMNLSKIVEMLQSSVNK